VIRQEKARLGRAGLFNRGQRFLKGNRRYCCFIAVWAKGSIILKASGFMQAFTITVWAAAAWWLD
jgi:hypothetical protein